MAAWLENPIRFLAMTNGTTATPVYRVLVRLPASAVQEFKGVVGLTDKSANFKGQLGWRVIDADEDQPGAVTLAGSTFISGNTKTGSGLIDLSGSAAVDAAAWVEIVFAAVNTSGTAVESANVWVQIQGRD